MAAIQQILPQSDVPQERLIHLKGVTKCYPKLSKSSDHLSALWQVMRGQELKRHHQIITDISFDLMRGESLGIIGENGAGKSTLLKMIAGVVNPTRGKVQVNGRLGALLELGAGFHAEHTGRDNIRIAASLMGLSAEEIKRKTPEIIEFADIGSYIDEPIKHYSSGMSVRLGFAVVSALEPEILITDEVFAVGDESFQKKCTAWLNAFRERGGTLLLCSHSMFLVQKLCKRAAWIHEGKLHRYGDTFEVTQQYLAYHEEKSNQEEHKNNGDGSEYRVENIHLWQNEQQTIDPIYPMGSHLKITGQVKSPDDRMPNVAVGIVRADGTPIYGSTSVIDDYTLTRVEPNLYSFQISFPNLILLPGAYRARAHALDPEEMRLFDTAECAFQVTGKSREFGMCYLEHSWE